MFAVSVFVRHLFVDRVVPNDIKLWQLLLEFATVAVWVACVSVGVRSVVVFWRDRRGS